MTMQEYKRVQCPAILEPFWIGQGYGYKNMSPLLRTESWSGVPDDEIIYLLQSHSPPDGGAVRQLPH